MRKRLSWLGGVVALALLAGPRPVSGYDWNAFKGGANLSRETVESTDYTPQTLAWQRLLDGPILASPTFVNGRVYVGTRKGHYYCLDAATGATLWERVEPQGNRIDGTPTVVHGRIFGVAPGTLVCLDAATGAVLWKRYGNTEPMSSPLVTHGMVVVAVGSPSRDIVAYGELTGEELWRYDTGQCSYSSPVEYRGLIYCASSSGDCFALDLDGQLVWKLANDGSQLGGMSSLEPRYGNVYYVPGGWDYKLYCLRASDGSVLWSGNPGAPPPGGGPPWNEEFLQEVLSVDPSVREQFMRDWGGRHQFDPEDLLAYQMVAQYNENPALLDDDFPVQPPFTMPTTNAKPSSPAVGSNVVVFGLKAVLSPGTARFSVICMNALTGEPRWWYQQVLPAALIACDSTPAVARDRVLVGVANQLLTFDLSSGTLLDTRTLDADVYSSPAIANGMVLVGTLAGSVYAFQTANHAPAVPDGPFSPADGETVTTPTPTLSWPASVDPDPGHGQGTLRYLLEVDDDQELDLSADQYATAQGEASLVLPTLPNGTYLWRVRTADPEGALSPWSAARRFTVAAGADSLGSVKDAVNFTAIPGNRQALFTWQDPPGFDGDGYRISWSDEFGQGYGPLDLGRTQSTILANLLNGVTYTAQLKAYRNGDHAVSAGVTAVFKPRALISLNGKEYASVTAALEDAKNGDTILLGSGTITENVTIRKRVDLEGVGPGITILSGADAGKPVITVENGGRTKVSLMTLTHGTDGVFIDHGGEADLWNLILMGLVNGVHADNGGKVGVVNCTISDNSGHGIWLDANAGVQVTALRNNIIAYNGGKGILGTQHGDVAVSTYSDLFTNVGGDYGLGAGAGIGDISLDPLFVAKSPSDYRLKPESPCRDAADPADPFLEEPAPNGGRRDQGAYGGIRFGGPGSDAGLNPVVPPGCFLSAARARR